MLLLPKEFPSGRQIVPNPTRLRQNLFHNVAVHIRQAERPTLKLIGELRVVDPQRM